MAKNAWDYTLEVISIATDIDFYNNKLSEITNNTDREIISAKVDRLESRLFEIKNKLKKAEII